MVLSTAVELDSGASEVSDDATAEELAVEEEAVIGEFSVVLSVTVPMLELGAFVET